MAVEVGLQGVEELTRKLREIVPALRKKALLNALRAGARVIRDAARKSAPELAKATPYRTPGLLKKSLSVRTSKSAKLSGDVGVFVNVRPAKGAKFRTKTTKVFGLKIKQRRQTRAGDRGAKSRLDPFYWRFLEFGTKHIKKREFLQDAAKLLQPKALPIFQRHITKWFAKTNATGKVQP